MSTDKYNNERSFELLDKKTVYDGYFQMVRYRLRHTLFAGGWSGEMVREVFERGHAASVLLYDPLLDKVVMLEQFRVGAINTDGENHTAWLWEVVAGIIEPGETVTDVVHREAQEEAGCIVSDLILMYNYLVSPGGTTESNVIFCGRVDASQAGGIHGLAQEHEDIKVHVLPVTTALDMLRNGQIRSAPAIIALQWLALYKNEVRQRWQ